MGTGILWGNANVLVLVTIQNPLRDHNDSTVDRVLALNVLKAGSIPIPFRVPKALPQISEQSQEKTLAPKQNKSKLIELYIIGFWTILSGA